MTKLSEPQNKALRYLLAVEMHGSVSPEMWEKFDRYSPKGRTLGSLASKGLITPHVTDEAGMTTEPHKLTRTGYIHLAFESFETKEESNFAKKRLDEINDATRRQSEKNSEIKARAEKAAQKKFGAGYTVEQAREIEKELRSHETIEAATPIEVISSEIDEAISTLANHIVSAMTGETPERIAELTGDGVVPGNDDGIRVFDSFESLFASLAGEQKTPEPVELPELPENRCGNVFYEELQCTREPFHLSEEHGYSPGYGLAEFTWVEERRNAYFSELPKELIDQAMKYLRDGRDAAIREKIRELEDIANGDTSLPDLTEAAKLATRTAQEVCELNGFERDDVMHSHDHGNAIQICTSLPFGQTVHRFCVAAATRIAMDLGWTNGCFSIGEQECGHVAIVVQKESGVPL